MSTTVRVVFTIAIYFSFVVLTSTSSFAQGSFEGRVVVEWLVGETPERNMRLVEPFAYIDPKMKKWIVPTGAVINGASIPESLWSLVGSPYTGNYRRASVVHDYYCGTKTETWEDVHLMFYNAMIAGGVGEIQAKLFYAAVYARGPRWKRMLSKNLEGRDEMITVPLIAKVDQSFLEQTSEWIKAANPSIGDINKRLDSGITIR